MRFRITIILMIAIGGLTALSVGTVLFVSAAASIRNTLELMRSQARLMISAVERGVVDHLAPAQNLIADLSGRVADGSLDISDRERLAAVLGGALAPAPQIGGVVVFQTDDSGLWVDRHDDGRIRVEHELRPSRLEIVDFLAGIADTEGIRWGAPYYREGETFMTIASPLFRDGSYVGAIATGISLVQLSRFVGDDLTDSAMTAFVLYGDDMVLAHPAMLDPQYSELLSPAKPLLSTQEIDDPVLARFADLPPADLPSKGDFDIRESGGPGEENGDGPAVVILSVSTGAFGTVPWNIGVHVPVDAVSQQMKRLVGSILISLGLLVLAVAGALLLARRIARPIRAVSAAAGKIERLELDDIEPLPPSRIRELDEQARSFNRMVGGLRWFQAYVPQTLVRRLMDASDGPAAVVREAELTVMFTDIVGFTPLSENMPVKELAEMLNRHFEMLNACIEAESGTLDKYIGDATMAFWGAPEPIPDHAARACRTALAISKVMQARKASGATPEIRIKIAIHTGPLTVGNIGAPSRMNYTVIGDTVNVCARIESLAGEFDDGSPASILVSGDVVAAAGDAFVFETLGERAVKGRAQSVEIWRLVGEARGGVTHLRESETAAVSPG